MLVALIVLALAFWGLWNIDMARQTIRITWLNLTGGMWKLRGRTETRMMESRALGEQRQVIVYLPPGYDKPENAYRRYPVLYLLHGFPDPGDGWARFGLAPQMVDQLIVQRGLPPILIALPDAHGKLGKFGDGEYIDAPAGHGAPGTRIADYITTDVPRWMDAHYRTIPTPLGRLLAGSSTGAYAAVNLGLHHPDVFGTLIGFSGYYEADLRHFGRELWGPVPDPARLAAESPIQYVSRPRHEWDDTFVFLGNGVSDYDEVKQQTDRMATQLDAAKIKYERHRLIGHHSWDLWRGMLADALETATPRLKRAAETASPGSGTEPRP